jgi:hypothetical protein
MCLNQKSPMLERMKEKRRAELAQQMPSYPESLLITLPTEPQSVEKNKGK